MTRRFTVISGGPGTGKTATVARVLAILIELAGNREPRIALTAPTGKAAMRLQQSIARTAGQLPLAEELCSGLPTEVTTIHRLLGAIPGAGIFRHNRDNRLSCDVRVVDEASMVDLRLMTRLLEAVPDDARILLLGDRDQLASVEAGSVMSDIGSGASSPTSSRLPETEGGENRPAVVHLTRSYRFGPESGIGRLSALINGGDGKGALELVKSGGVADLAWRPLPVGAAFEAAFSAAAACGFGNYLLSTAPDGALEELERFRILAPHREGVGGVANLNRLCEAALALRGRDGREAYRLKPVMVTANNYDLGLFNGDTGVIMDDPAGGCPAAWFGDSNSGLRRISSLRLPPHETAFALTVHKSQGSEFDRVLLILPERFSETLGRELLYTAVTRARVHVEIWGREEVFLRAVERRIERESGLRDRLWGRGGSRYDTPGA
jgi:exodeoxyribonuclease V alpha subunit